MKASDTSISARATGRGASRPVAAAPPAPVKPAQAAKRPPAKTLVAAVPTKASPAAKTRPVSKASPVANVAAAAKAVPPKAASPQTAPAPARQAKPPTKSEEIVTPKPVEAAVPAPEPVAAAEPPVSRPMPGMGGRPPMPGMRPQPARAMAREENFAEGDYVVYPTHGVGRVEKIATEEIAGHKLELIHITFEENRMTLRVPVAKARTAGLRRLATRKMFDEALAVLKGRARVKRTMWSRRAQEYEAKINSGDPLAIAEVVRDLHRNAGQPDQSFSERQIYEAALDRLAAELAALDQSDKPAAITKLGTFLKSV